MTPSQHEALAHEHPVHGELDRASSAALTNNGVNVCPESWYLRRFGQVPDAEAIQDLGDGTRQHERIGRTAERIVDIDALRRGLLIILVVLAALLLAASAGLLGLAGPTW